MMTYFSLLGEPFKSTTRGRKIKKG